MWDKNAVYPKMENEYSFEPHMNDIFVNDYKIKSFIKDGNDSAILVKRSYNPPKAIFQNLAVKGKNKNVEADRLRNGYTKDTLTSDEICEIVNTGGKVYEGLVNQKNFRISPVTKIIRKLVTFGKKTQKRR